MTLFAGISKFWAGIPPSRPEIQALNWMIFETASETNRNMEHKNPTEKPHSHFGNY